METLHATGKDLQIKLKDVTISYDDFGKGETPIIFIHGFPFNKSMWSGQMELLKNTHRVIAYDTRGYGKSTSGSEKQSMSVFADDLLHFMDALDIQKAIICGFSMGGYTLLKAISRGMERFEALILCDTQSIADSIEVIEKRNETIEQVKSGRLSEFSDGFLEFVFCPLSMKSMPHAVDKAREMILGTSQLSISDGLTAISERVETSSNLSQINVPVLILCGQEDLVTPVTQSEFLHNQIKKSELHIIDRAGHMSNLEQPEEFNKHLVEFLDKIEK
jgi:3-oxoadipate enol-lactonase